MNKKVTATWNLTPLYSGDADPQISIDRKAVTKANEKFMKKWQTNSDYLTNVKKLKEALDEYEEINRSYGTTGKEGYYFWLRTMQDQNDPALKALFNKSQDFSNQLRNQIQFFELRLAKIPKDKQKLFLKEPSLAPYKHFLEKIFAQAEYLLSENEEKIMNLKEDPAYGKWVQMVASFLSKEQRELLTEEGTKQLLPFEALMSLMSSQNKNVRDSAADAVNEILNKYTDVAEQEINAILANKKVDDELRNMPRPDFSRHLSDDIDSETVDTLIQTISQRNDIANRFYKLKAKLLGVPKLAYHERNVEFGKIDKNYPFDDGKALVMKVFQELDPEFAHILERLAKHGQIDIYPRAGKRGGAFCVYWLISLPTYVLLNYTDKLRDVTTLAHEMGHAINNELMKQKQNSLSFGTPMATAEVASVFMEDFVLQEILKNADDELRLAVLMTRLNDDIATIFRQTACYQFEQELHQTFREKGYLSHQEIGQIFKKHMSAYMGPGVDQSLGSENWWIYWSHIRTFFYVYSYASGLLIGKSMQNSVKADKKFVGKVKEFLSSGTSDTPKNIFKKMGIDITDADFWNKGLDEVENLLKETEKLAKKLGKI